MLTVLIRSDSRYRVNRKVIRRAIVDTLTRYKVTNLSTEVSVLIVGGRKMAEISKKYLGDDSLHDVLSFPLEDSEQRAGFINPPDEVLRLGDIVLCWPEVVSDAGRDNVMVDEEIYRLVAHGLEHLLGKHHGEEFRT